MISLPLAAGVAREESRATHASSCQRRLRMAEVAKQGGIFENGKERTLISLSGRCTVKTTLSVEGGRFALAAACWLLPATASAQASGLGAELSAGIVVQTDAGVHTSEGSRQFQ